jgi:hypothetical protein
MTRLEFVKVEGTEKFKKVIKALLNGESIEKSYTDKDGNKKVSSLVNKNRLFLGNNLSISVSRDNDDNIYIGVDYLSSDDRIKISKLKQDKNITDF